MWVFFYKKLITTSLMTGAMTLTGCASIISGSTQTKTVQVNGRYVANILFGGFIGLLIVDLINGATYTLNPSDVNAVLDANQSSVKKGEKVTYSYVGK